MPDHLHLVDAKGEGDALRRVLQRHGRRFGARWDCMRPQPCTTRAILGRAIRYVILNALRDGLVGDPWCWPWSTLRDLGGVVADPWTELDRVAGVLHRHERHLVAYLSSEAGLPIASPVASGTPIVVGLDAVAAAVASNLRCRPVDVERRGRARQLFVQLAYECGTPRQAVLAERCRTTVRTIQSLRRGSDPEGLAPAILCLTDPRLRIHDAPLGIRAAR